VPRAGQTLEFSRLKFTELGLAPEILRAIADQGYETPTPIQAQAIPVVLDGSDLMACAQTGTGKTAGFTLPILNNLAQAKTTGPRKIRVLILTPTRELAAQVGESVATYGAHLPFKSLVIFGGVSMNPADFGTPQGRRHPRRDTRPPARSRAATQRRSFRRRSAGARRGRPHARHGLHPRHPPRARAGAEKAPDLLFSATFSDEIRELAATFLTARSTSNPSAATPRPNSSRSRSTASTANASATCWSS
jgi:ATP-dependent RNA helicase RhlE